MANTWAGMTADNISQKSIATLEEALVPMAGFTLDMSTDAVEQGTTVSTRIVPAATAATDLVDDESGSYESVVDDQATTQVQVTLDPHPVNGFALTDSEAQNIAAGVWSSVSELLVATYTRSIAKEVLDDVFGLITAANFGAAALTTAAWNFDSDSVADLRQAAREAGWDMNSRPVLVVNPAYYNALCKDDSIKNWSASQSEALRTGQLPNLYGFDVIEAPTLPGNSENLVGFIALPSAIAVAMRGVQTQSPDKFESYDIVQDDTVGAVLPISSIWTPKYRRTEWVFETLFGVAKANASALKRITSA